MDPGACRVQGELSDGDRHAASALVAQTEDPLVVGHDDEPHVRVRPLAQDLRDPVSIGGRDPDPAGPPDDVAELLARSPDGGGVHDRQELLEVLGEQPVEQRCVPILERREADVPLERVILAPEMLDLEADLLLDREHPVRQQASQVEGVAFGIGEAEVLGQQAAAEQRRAGQGDGCRPARCDGIERGGEWSHRSRIAVRMRPWFGLPGTRRLACRVGEAEGLGPGSGHRGRRTGLGVDWWTSARDGADRCELPDRRRIHDHIDRDRRCRKHPVAASFEHLQDREPVRDDHRQGRR